MTEADPIRQAMQEKTTEEAPGLQLEGDVQFSEALLFANGKDKPAMSPTQMREFFEVLDSFGGWPFSKGLAVEEFGRRYAHTPTGWIPQELVA